MKQTAYPFCLLFLLITLPSAELDWEWKNPLPAGYHLNAVSALNEHTAIAAGEHGVILKTTDGNEWKILLKTLHHNYRSIHFVDSLTGWIFGSANSGNETVVLRTIDGGTTWTEFVSGGLESYYDIFFISKDTGWISSATDIYKTFDGGENWQELYTDTNHTFYTLHFINPDTGWVSGSAGTILKTTDGGTSWTPYETPDDHNSVYDLFFINADTGWAVGGKPLLIGYTSVFMKTVDGGETWKLFVSTGSGIYESVHFTNSNTGWICTHTGNILKTTDGGTTWDVQADFKGGDLRSLHFANSQSGYCVGFNGRIVKTADGEKWDLLSQGEQLHSSELTSLLFTTEKDGFAGGYWYELSSSNPILYRTSDSGNTWRERPLNGGYTHFHIMDIFFTDPANGKLLLSRDTSSYLLSTHDSGATWTEAATNTNLSFKGTALFFHSPDTGILVGAETYTYGRIVQTTDGGKVWNTIPVDSSDTIPPLKDLYFVNSRKAWAVGNNGTIITTSDGGNSWQAQNSSITSDLYTVQFINETTGWAIGYNKVLATIDGGKTWTDRSPITTELPLFSALYFTDSQTGWIATNTDTLFFTDNGGHTWKEHPIGIGRNISTIYSRDGRNLWAAGNLATILHSYYEGPISIDTESAGPLQQHIPVTYYSCPGSNHGTFSFSLQNPATVSLMIYSLSGKCVAVPFCKKFLSSGNHRIIWNRKGISGKYISPGVYPTKLRTDRCLAVNRFILL